MLANLPVITVSSEWLFFCYEKAEDILAEHNFTIVKKDQMV